MDVVKRPTKGLMDLPTELRFQILREVFTFGKSYLRTRRFYLSGVPLLKRLWPGPLLVNRQFRLEALTIILGDPLWRIVTRRFAWGIQYNDIAMLRRLQVSCQLGNIRRLRLEFDLDSQARKKNKAENLSDHTDEACSSLIACCDLLALARASLDLEISWIEHVHFEIWDETLSMLAPLSRLSNLRSITITQYWLQPKEHGPSYSRFAEHLKLFTGLTPILSLPEV